VPKTELADELRQRSPKAMVISVGDCRRVGNLYTAIQQGHQVGSHL
jgi:coenzyme F420-reducing hydrogenase gamma subunit